MTDLYYIGEENEQGQALQILESELLVTILVDSHTVYRTTRVARERYWAR